MTPGDLALTASLESAHSSGIPFWPRERLHSMHQHRLLTLERDLDLIEPEISKAFQRTFRNLVDWFHLLPASQFNHHAGPGGLLSHSLEVAQYAVRMARSKMGDLSLPPARRREQERRFRVAVALAGLCHDLGKPISDLRILDPSGNQAWNPWEGSLIDWGNALGIDRYHAIWLRHRGTRHRHFSPLFLKTVVDSKLLHWMRVEGAQYEVELLDALIEETADGSISSLIRKADQESAARDLKDPRRSLGGTLERAPTILIVQAMRQLFEDGIWKLNQAGSPLWLLECGLYLSWPSAQEDLKHILQRDQIHGIPYDPDLLAEFLQDQGLAAGIPGSDPPSSIFSYLRPVNLKFPLRLLRLRSPSLVFQGYPPEWMAHEDPGTVEDLPETNLNQDDPRSPEDPGISLALTLRQHSKDYHWELSGDLIFLDHLEAGRTLGKDPQGLMRALEGSKMLEADPSGGRRKVRLHRGRRGIFLNRETSLHLLPGMEQPLKRAARNGRPA